MALLALVAVFVVGHGGFPNFPDQPLPVRIEAVGMPLMLAGQVAAWRWEITGGVAVIAGFAVFLVAELLVNGRPPGGALPLFAIPGVLFLVSGAMAKAMHEAALS